MLDALATALEVSDEVKKATRVLLTPEMSRKYQPYVGMIATSEEKIIEDTTGVRWEVDVDFILLKKGKDIESLIDGVKEILFSANTVATIGALHISFIGGEAVAIVNDDDYSSTRIATTITYVVTKGSI